MVVALLVTQLAMAQSVAVGPTLGVVGESSIFVRPGLRLGYEPAPMASLELHGDINPAATQWDAGLALAGRLWLNQSEYQGEGLFLLGRFSAGFSGSFGKIGPFTGVYGGFGGRPAPWLNIEASFGPEWASPVGARWRTELGVSFVIDPGANPGGGSVRHHPRKVPR